MPLQHRKLHGTVFTKKGIRTHTRLYFWCEYQTQFTYVTMLIVWLVFILPVLANIFFVYVAKSSLCVSVFSSSFSVLSLCFSSKHTNTHALTHIHSRPPLTRSPLLSISVFQVVQVLRAIDRDEGGNDSTVYFSIPPESSAALNFSVRDSGGRHSIFPSLCSSLDSCLSAPPLADRLFLPPLF